MKNVGIIGAGVSGLSLGRLLKKECNVEILEIESSIGGIAKTRTVDNATYHPKLIALHLLVGQK